MANTYTQLVNHIVFSVKHRQKLIKRQFQEPLNKYITGIVQNKGQKMLAINGVEDHIHLLVCMKPDMSASELVREVKKSSTAYINAELLKGGNFSWQIGFGAFSIRKSEVSVVAHYIENQFEHHKTATFEEEYRNFMKEFDIDFDPNYLLD